MVYGFHRSPSVWDDLDIRLDDEDLSAGAYERPTWEDHEKCVWDAIVDGKTAEILEDARPEPGEVLAGAYLKDASLVGIDWFTGTSLVGADFTGADVNSVDFSDANLLLATLTDVSAINADFSGSNLEGRSLPMRIFGGRRWRVRSSTMWCSPTYTSEAKRHSTTPRYTNASPSSRH